MARQNLSLNMFCVKYLWSCFAYCSQWLLVIVLSSYFEGLVEIIYDKNSTSSNHETNQEGSPILVSAISMIVQSNFLVAFLISLLVQSDRKAPSLKPWIALLLTTIALQISDKVKSINVNMDTSSAPSSTFSSSSAHDTAVHAYQAHLNQLSCSLSDRSISIMLGALCAIYLMRDDIMHRRGVTRLSSPRQRSSSSTKRIAAIRSENSFTSILTSKLYLIVCVSWLLFSSKLTGLLHPVRNFDMFSEALIIFFIQLFHTFAWAYLIVCMSCRGSNPNSSTFLRNISSNNIWDGLSRFLFSSIFLIRYPVIEHIVR